MNSKLGKLGIKWTYLKKTLEKKFFDSPKYTLITRFFV